MTTAPNTLPRATGATFAVALATVLAVVLCIIVVMIESVTTVDVLLAVCVNNPLLAGGMLTLDPLDVVVAVAVTVERCTDVEAVGA
jgi:hypothetical protein